MDNKPTFEEKLAEIDSIISKRKNKWTLHILSWMDFNDVSQILRIHIHKKWHLYDPSRPLGPWINTVISSQIKNLVKNNYSNYSRPCLRCAAMESEDSCRIYVKQCSDCPLFAKWEKFRKRAHDTKLPVSLEFHQQEVYDMPDETVDIQKGAENLHVKMQTVLKPVEWNIYKALFVDNKSEEQLAKEMGFKTSEEGRYPGYKQLKNLKKAIMIKVKKTIYGGDLDLF